MYFPVIPDNSHVLPDAFYETIFDVIDHFSSFTCYRSCLLNKSRKRRSLCSNLGGIDPLDPGHLNFRQVCCLTFGMRNQTSEFSNGSPETVLIFFYDFPCGVVNLHVPVNLSQKVIQYKFDHRTVEVGNEFRIRFYGSRIRSTNKMSY